MATLHPAWRIGVAVSAALFSVFALSGTFVNINLSIRVSAYLGVSFSLIFLVYKARPNSPERRPSLFDLLCVVAAVLPTVNYAVSFEQIIRRAGIVTTDDMVFGVLISLASIEACRRMFGWALPSISIAVVAYAYFGQQMPGIFQHAGMSPERIISTIYSTSGVFGVVTRTFTVFVIIFIIFGAFLQQGGAGQAFTNLAIATFGRRSGGAAKAAVASSAVAGSVLGTGAANIAVTGTFTIPLMKKRGYPPHVAAAFETVASIGGHLLPPVMGAAAFVMASIIGVPYIDIVVIATVPALLLYVALYANVHFYTGRHNIERRSALADDAPRLREALLTDGPLLSPLIVLVAAMAMGYSPFRAAVAAIIAAVIAPQVLGIFNRKYSFGIRKIWDALVGGALQSLVVGSVAGVLGILVGVLLLPGTGLRFASWIVHLSGGNMIVAILLIILTSYVLGMGMNITAAYIVIAIVAAPALVEFGIPVIVAHLMIIWFSQDSSFTPPFALGAMIASGIAESDPMRTAWRSVLIGKAMYIIPLLMVYTPLLGLDGYDAFVFWTIFACAVGLILFAAVAERYFVRRLKLWESLALAVAALLLFYPEFITGLVGLGMGVGVYIYQKLSTDETTTPAPQMKVAGASD